MKRFKNVLAVVLSATMLVSLGGMPTIVRGAENVQAEGTVNDSAVPVQEDKAADIVQTLAAAKEAKTADSVEESEITDTEIMEKASDDIKKSEPANTDPGTDETSFSQETPAKSSDTQDEPSQNDASDKEEFVSNLTGKSSDGKVNVTLAMDETAGIPEGTTIEAVPVSGAHMQEVLAKAASTLNVNEDNLTGVAYDITLKKGGAEIQPTGKVHVDMTFNHPEKLNVPDNAEITDASVVHIHEGVTTEIKDGEAKHDASLATGADFTTDNFSIFGAFYTVEFLSPSDDSLEYILNGNESVKLSTVLQKIKMTEISFENIKDVVFSNSALVGVTKDTEGNDWTLSPKQAFGTKETLAITMEDGTEYKVKVIDDEDPSFLNAVATASLCSIGTISSTKVLVNNKEISDGDKIERNAAINVKMEYSISNGHVSGTLSPKIDENTVITYQLPTNVDFSTSYTESQLNNIVVRDADGTVAGKAQINTETNVLSFNLYQSYLVSHPNDISGKFSFNSKLKQDNIADLDNTTFDFEGDSKSYNLEPSRITGNKQNANAVNGRASFTVSLNVDAASNNVVIKDALGSNLSFDNDSDIKLLNSLGQEVKTFTASGQNLTAEAGRLQAGNYSLVYSVKVGSAKENSTENNGANGNTATWTWTSGTKTDNSGSASSHANVTYTTITKSGGKFTNTNNGIAQWTVTLNDGTISDDISGKTFTDTLGTGHHYLIDESHPAVVTQYNPNGTTEKKANLNSDNVSDGKLSYTFPQSSAATRYVITYYTQIDDYNPETPPSANTEYSNTADFNGKTVETKGQYTTETPAPLQSMTTSKTHALKSTDSDGNNTVQWTMTIHLESSTGIYSGPVQIIDSGQNNNKSKGIEYGIIKNSINVNRKNPEGNIAPLERAGDSEWDYQAGTKYNIYFENQGFTTSPFKDQMSTYASNFKIQLGSNLPVGDYIITYTSLDNAVNLSSADSQVMYNYYNVGNNTKEDFYSASSQYDLPMLKNATNTVQRVKVNGKNRYKITWDIIVNGTKEAEGNDSSINILSGTPIVVTDSIPDSLDYIKGSTKITKSYYNADSNLISDKDPDIEGNTLTWSYNQPDNYTGKTVVIFETYVSDEFYKTYMIENGNGTISFSNTATATAGNEKGKSSHTVEVPADRIKKAGRYNKDSTSGGVIDYYIEVNKDEYDLAEDDTLTLTDTMTGDGQYVPGSLKVYSAYNTGTFTPVEGSEITENVVFPSSLSGNSFTITIPDETHLFVVYQVSPIGDTGDDFKIRNSADLSGRTKNNTSSTISDKVADLAGQIVGKKGYFSVTKKGQTSPTDSTLTPLEGAEFQLYKVDLNNSNDELVETKTTNSNGVATFGNTDTTLNFDTLYYYVETQAPLNNGISYALDNTKHYFVYKGSSWDANKQAIQSYLTSKKLGSIDQYTKFISTFTDEVVDQIATNETGSLKITKVISGGGTEALGKTYKFTVQDSDNRYYTQDGASGNWTTSDDHAYVEITGSGSITLNDVPVGKYTITEVAEDAKINGYTLSTTPYNGVATTNITKGQDTAVTITNTYTEAGKGSAVLSIKKASSGEGAPATIPSIFNFTVSAVTENAPLPDKKTITNNNGEVTFDPITYTQEKTDGYVYKIQETGFAESATAIQQKAWTKPDYASIFAKVIVKANTTTNGYDTSVKYYSDEKCSLELTGENIKITNVYKAAPATVTISGTKSYNEAALQNNAGKTFNFTMQGTSDNAKNQTYTASVTGDGKNNQTFSFESITYDAAGTYVYSVTENNNSYSGFSKDGTVYTVTVTVTDNGTGQLQASPSYKKGEATVNGITFTNNYSTTSTKFTPSVSKVINGLPADVSSDKKFNFHLTQDGSNYTDSTTVTGAGTGSFKTITYDTAGTYTYEISEDKGSDAGYSYSEDKIKLTVSVTNENGVLKATAKYGSDNGATSAVFTNTYKAAKTSVTISGKKAYEGKALEKSKDKTFSFTMRGTSSNTSDKKYTASATGDGITNNQSFSFDSIEYTEAGTYTYSVSEDNINESYHGFYKDGTVYTITVTVTDNGSGQLAASTEIKKGDAVASEGIKFTNTYSTTSTKYTPRVTKRIEDLPVNVTSDKAFTFNLKDTTNDNSTYTDSVTVTGANTASFNPITYTEAGIYKYTISEEKGNAAGYTYDPNPVDLIVTVTDDDGALKATAKYGDDAKAESAVFTNTYSAAPVSVKISGTKSYDTSALPKSNGKVFTFTMAGTGGDSKSYTTKVTGDGTNNQSFEFSPDSYTKAGTFTYTVKENDIDSSYSGFR